MFLIFLGAMLYFVTRISPDGEGVMRVLDGEIVSIHDFQYVVRIEKRIVIHINQSTWTTIYHESHCSASAIARKWILTAAHCIKMDTSIITNVTYFEVNDFNASETYVVVYGTMYGGPNPNNTISKILKAFVPTSYFVSYRSNIIVNDDVGLLMTEPIYLTTYGRISALDVPSLYGREVTVLGSGVMGSNKNTNFDETLSGNMPIQYLKGMVARCHRKGVENRLCIMRRCGDTGMICGGDSGGPVLHISGIIGLNSVVYKSCSHSQDNHKDPILVGFSPVAPLLRWITDMIQNV